MGNKKIDISRLAMGDREAFLSLYENFFVALCIFARNFVNDHTEAEDIVQEVFCRIYDNRMRFENIGSLRSYIYGAVRNECLNHIREMKRRRVRESRYIEEARDESIFFDLMVENEVYRQLHRLLAELPPQCRNIFERTLDGFTSEQIAAALNISAETVKTQRKKAKRIMKERYALLYKTFSILF